MVRTKAKLIDPMLLLRTDRLPAGDQWSYEIKLDGYRALAIKSGGKVQLRCGNNNDFNRKYPAIVEALAALPDETVIDGEVVALDAHAKPSFNILQNFGSGTAPLYFYVFDLLVVGGEKIMTQPLFKRRQLLDACSPKSGGADSICSLVAGKS
jgi:bifunctional non-homologous end joining protein LigD